MVDKINAFVFGQKMNRHKLNFVVDEEKNTLLLGGMRNEQLNWLTTVVLPFAIAFIVFLIFWTGLISVRGRGAAKLVVFLIGLPFILGTAGAARMAIRKKHNAGQKFFAPGTVHIKDIKGVELEIKSELIDQIKTDIMFDNSGIIGKVILKTKDGSEYALLAIEDKVSNDKYLRDDLDYIEAYIKKVIF